MIGLTLAALGFLVLVALINFRGVGESVKTNVVLTLIELSGLLFILLIGAIALGSGEGDWSAVTGSTSPRTPARSPPSAAPRRWPSSPSSGSRTR